jgi:hypothetical protein
MVIVVSTVLLLTSAALADFLPIVDANFSAVQFTCALGYAYQGNGGCSCPAWWGFYAEQDFNDTPGFGWTLVGGAGLTGPATDFNPPSFTGLPFTQAALLQGQGAEVSQSIYFPTGGDYVLSFYLGSRYNASWDGNQTVSAELGGVVLNTWTLTTGTPFTLERVPFSLSTGGNYTLAFLGQASGDHTAFLSDVSIDSILATVPEPPTSVLILTGLVSLAGVKRRYFQ